MQFLLTVPANNERGPRYMEKALASIHQARLRREIGLAYGLYQGQIGILIRCNRSDRDTVLEPIIANYPQCSITPIEDSTETTGREVWNIDIELKPELFPILRHSQFEDSLNHNFADPVSGLLRAILPDDALECRIELRVRRASHRRTHTARAVVRLLDREFFRKHHSIAAFYAWRATRPRGWRVAWMIGMATWFTPHRENTTLETSTSRSHEREEDLQAASEKVGGHLFESTIRLTVKAMPKDKQIALERLNRMAGAFGAFTKSRLATFQSSKPHQRAVQTDRTSSFLLSHEELATLWHPPTATTQAERLQSSEFQELEAPAFIHSKEEGAVVLGSVRFRDDKRLVGLALEDRRRHLVIIGKTGMGKTTLIQNMIQSDMLAGRGVCLVDPHGDLAESIPALVPSGRTNDVIIFDAANSEFALSFNPLECNDPTRIDQVTSGVVSAFKKINTSWGPRLEDTLRNAVFAIVERGGNLMTVMQLLSDRSIREQIVPVIADPVVRSFWLHEFASWSDSYRTEAVAAISNKLRPFLTSTNLRAIVSQPGRSLNLREVMDDGRILLVNLSKGRLGEDNSTLLGALLISSIQQAAMTRANVPELERRDFFLYVDEFQNFTTGSFASVLSEARKFRLSLIIAHQYLSQLDEDTANAVFGNVGSIISFQVGSDDAERLALQLGKYPGQIAAENLTGLPKYTAYTRLLVDGVPSKPFSISTLPPPMNDLDPDRAEIVRRVSRRRFGSDRVVADSCD